MIAFAFLFLGLVVGEHDVELIVEGEVAEVAIVLDGVEQQVLSAPPWRFTCDLGERLRPHLLEAIARDAAGREIARARQLINLPRSVAEVAILLEGEDRRRPDGGRLLWQHLEFSQAERIDLTVDGERLALTGEQRFELPDLEGDRLHELRAEVVFPDRSRYSAEVRFGGPSGGRIDAELTGVTRLARGGRPSLRALDGQLTARGTALRPVALEQSPARLAVVVDLAAAAALREFAELDLSAVASLRAGEQVEFFFPRFRRGARGARLFEKSQSFGAGDGGLAFLMTHLKLPAPPPDPPLSDALAAAAVAAADGNRPRAVILLLSDRPRDASAFRAGEVLAFCRDLQVPVVIWSIGRGGARRVSEDRRRISIKSPWGPTRDVSSANRIAAAVAALRELLDAQYTVWVEGSFRPDEIELVPGSRFRLAGDG